MSTNKLNLAEQSSNSQRTAIEGLKLVYNSAASLDIKTGVCYAENGDYINVTSPITKSSLSLTNATWYHVYVYLSGGSPAAEVVTTAPVAWKGTAYSKTGDTSHRYVGSIIAIGSNTMASFIHTPDDGIIFYTGQQDGSPFRVLSNGNATTETSISLTGVLPSTAKKVYMHATDTNGTFLLVFGNSLDTVSLPSGYILAIGNGKDAYVLFPCNDSQVITYAMQGAGGGAYLDIYGYVFER